jgi:hypothetical protein
MVMARLPREARELQERTTTIVTRGGPGDPIRALIRKRMAGFMRMNAEAYCEAFWDVMSDNPEAKLILFKRSGGIASKIAEMSAGERDATEVETWIMSEWGDGAYQLQPEVAGKMYGPPSKVLRFGEVTDDAPKRIEQDSIDAELSVIMKRLGHITAVGKLAEVAKSAEGPPKGDGDMDMTGIAALMQAQQAPLMAMLTAAETRAQRAEERMEKMLDRVMAERTAASAGSQPLFAEILKNAVGNKDTLALLLNGVPPAESTWLDTIRDLAREFGPAIQGMLAQVMERQSLTPALPPRGGAPGVVPTVAPHGPRPTVASDNKGDGAMPMELNEEQQMAKDNLVEFIKAGDFENAFAALEAFPGLMPVQGGAVPLGEFIISKIDPKVNARVYLPQLAMLIPEFKGMVPQALAFVQAIQQRILADDEAARRAGGTDTPADMRPTTRGEE